MTEPVRLNERKETKVRSMPKETTDKKLKMCKNQLLNKDIF